jgi:hypothetical protein
VAEIVARTSARVISLGDMDDDKPSLTLGFEDGEVLLELASFDDCRALAPLLGRDDARVTITVTVPEGRRRG